MKYLVICLFSSFLLISSHRLDSNISILPVHSCFDDLHSSYSKEPTAVVTPIYQSTLPRVIASTHTADIKVLAKFNGTPSRVEFSSTTSQANRMLNDQGQDGDITAGDGIYTATVKPSYNPVTKQMGYIDAYEGTERTSRINFFIPVLPADKTLIQPIPISASGQKSQYVYNLRMPVADLLISGNSAQIEAQKMIAKSFYSSFGDQFQFLNIVYTKGFIDNRFHYTVQNIDKGISSNSPIINLASQYGSPRRLIGVNVFPNYRIYDLAEQGMSHECAHQWLQYTRHPLLSSGEPHWPISNLANAIMGFSGGATNQGSQLPGVISKTATGYNYDNRSVPENNLFNQWELYFMGLLKANEVSQVAYIFKDQTNMPTSGSITSTAINELRLSDLVSHIGSERTPGPASSTKNFRTATIVVSENLLDKIEMTYYDWMAQRAELKSSVILPLGFLAGIQMANPFFVTTGGRANLTSILEGTVSQEDFLHSVALDIYPNPTSNLLIIKLKTNQKIREVQIINKFGQSKNLPVKYTANELIIHVESLAPDFYYILLLDDLKYWQGRFIKI